MPPDSPERSTEMPDVFSGLTDERKLKAVNVLSYNGYQKGKKARTGAITCAARAAGVSVSAIYKWLEHDPEFVAAIEEVTFARQAEALDGIRQGARKLNFVACMMQLKTIDPEQFDDQLIRDNAKRAFDLKMFEKKCAHEMEMFEKKCAHEKEMLQLRIQGGLPAEDQPMPDFSFEETGPGERRHKDDENVH